MTIIVKYFGRLREQEGHAEVTLPATSAPRVVQEIWDTLHPQQPLQPNVLMAVNQCYARPDTPVHDGDEVAFFPPVTGG